jgi:hypothetical protein
MNSVFGQLSEFPPVITGDTHSDNSVFISPFHCFYDIRAVAGTAYSDQVVAGIGESSQLLFKNAFVSFIIPLSRYKRSIICKT